MKSCNSLLQTLHRLSEQAEQDALHAYGQALQVQEQAQSKLDAVQSELMEAWVERNQRLESGAAGIEFLRLEAQSQAVERRRRMCERALTVARNQARLAFTRLLEARHARAVVDKVIAVQRRRGRVHRPQQEHNAADGLARHDDGLFGLLHPTCEPLWN